MRTRIKVCGITRPEDARAAVEAGVDAIGLVFYEPSPRYVDIATACAIAREVPGFVTLVGLFVNANRDDISRIKSEVPLQLLQFHGDETAPECQDFELPYIKALRVGTQKGALCGDNLVDTIGSHEHASGILLDTYRKGVPGGTGEQFDWELMPNVDRRLILAGGLHPQNVGKAVQKVKPYAIDCSGGVESAPGIKDAGRIRALSNAVRQADSLIYAHI